MLRDERQRAVSAMSIAELCKKRLCICLQVRFAWLTPKGRYGWACESPPRSVSIAGAVGGDCPMDEVAAFTFGSYRLISAGRTFFEGGKGSRLRSVDRARRPDDLQRGADRAGLAGHARRSGRRPGPYCGAAQSPWRWPCRQAVHRQPLWLGCAFISPVTRENALSATPAAPTGMARDREICRHCSRASSAATASSPGWRSSWSGAGSSHLPLGLYRRFPDTLRQRRTQGVTSPPLGTSSARKWVEKHHQRGMPPALEPCAKGGVYEDLDGSDLARQARQYWP